MSVNTEAKRKEIMAYMGVRDLVTMDDVIIMLRKVLGKMSGDIYVLKVIPFRSPLTPFNKQSDEVIDALYTVLPNPGQTKPKAQTK